MTVTLRVRSIVWFLTGAGMAVLVMVIVLQAWRVDAAPGDDDATFVPITPGCRYADTRQPGQGGPIGAGQTRQFSVYGANGPIQGKQCMIPNDAVGLLMNVTIDGQTAPNSFVAVWGLGGNPGTSASNPAAGEPPTQNAVTTDLAPGGLFNVYNDAGSVQVIIDINGYYTKSSLQELASRVADLEALTASMSAATVEGHPTVRFTGVNVQIVDGTGDSQCSTVSSEACNGRGNLFVGYNEDDGFTGPEARSGSHNIVVGYDNDWTSFSGLVAGGANTISGNQATVTGGSGNTASATNSSVSGGSGNTASGDRSSVSGGSDNTAGGDRSSVSGGEGNTASGDRSSVSGGLDSIASGDQSSVSGGEQNLASGPAASVTGGRTNWATGQQSSVSGGRDNLASGTRTKIVGGAGCTSNTSNGVLVGAITGTTCTQLN